jgi:hypothetical protein
MKAWIDVYETKHPHCRKYRTLMLPSRVLQVGPDADRHDVRLIDGRDMAGEYVIHTHCWGNASVVNTSTS